LQIVKSIPLLSIGDAVEKVIEQSYTIDFSGDEIYFSPGSGEPPRGIGTGVNPLLQPDLGNYTRKTYNEIKPFNPGGYSDGKSQMKRYKDSLEGDGWTPESIWKAPPLIGGPVTVLGRQIIYFNDFTGLIFYTDRIQDYQRIVELASVSGRQRTSRLRELREGLLGSAIGLDARTGIAFGASLAATGAATLVSEITLYSSLTRGLAF
jgi:hypothetical protein